MTETTSLVLAWDPRLQPIAGSVGELAPNCHAKIMSEDGKTEAAPKQRGEIWVQAPKYDFTITKISH
jgi:hypothetical protein